MSNDDFFKNFDAGTRIITIIVIIGTGIGWGLAIAFTLELDGYHILIPIGMCIGGQLTIMKIVDNTDMTFKMAMIILFASIIFAGGYRLGYENGKFDIESHESENERSSRVQQPNRG